jgi:DNA-binding MarR family transcriptional regulator
VKEQPDLAHADLDQVPVGRLLAIAGRLMSARFERFLDAQGLSHTGWLVLIKLGDGDALSLREVADRCYVTQATVTGVVDTLERDGLVVRERGTADRRVVRLRLTNTGRDRLAAAKANVAREMAPLFGDLTPREEAVVRRFLTRTVRRLGADQPEEPR